MSNARIVTGELANLFARALSVVADPAADANYPVSALSEGIPSRPFRWGAATSPARVTADLALFDGAMESWSGSPAAPAGWTRVVTGSGDVVETTVGGEVRSGSAAKFNNGGDTAELRRDITVRAGELLQFDGYARAAASGLARAKLQDLKTKRHLTSAGGWQAAETHFTTEAGTSYVQKLRSFQVEDWATVGGSLTTLRLTLDDGGAGGAGDFAFWDDAVIYPAVDALIALGHNLEPGLVAQLRSSTDAFASDDVLEAELAKTRTVLAALLASPIYRRWIRLQVTGDPLAKLYLGEGLLAQTTTLLAHPQWPIEEHAADPQERTGALQPARSYLWAEDELVGVALDFPLYDDASFVQFRDEVFQRSRHGWWPLLVMPEDTVPTRVYYGRIPAEDARPRTFLTARQARLALEPLPLPAFVA